MSADGKMLLVVQEQHLETLQVATQGNGSETRALSAGNRNRDGENGLAWMPDGKIVYSPGRIDSFDIWEMSADGANPQVLTNSDASLPSYLPVASFRGGFIAFVQRERNGDWNIWRMDGDGNNLKRRTQGGRNFSPAVSPDGQWVIFTHAQSGRNTLMKVPSGGGTASPLTDYDSIWPSVSPDGKWIDFGYSPGQDKPVTLALVRFAGGEPTKIFPVPVTGPYPVVWAPTPLAWTPDGRAIAFVNRANGIDNIWEQPVTGGPPKPVTHFTSDRIFAFDWSRDGRLALSRGRESSEAVLIKNFR